MLLFIKVNVLIDLRLFWGTLKPWQPGKDGAYEKCKPLWLPDEEKLSVEIVYSS